MVNSNYLNGQSTLRNPWKWEFCGENNYNYATKFSSIGYRSTAVDLLVPWYIANLVDP